MLEEEGGGFWVDEDVELSPVGPVPKALFFGDFSHGGGCEGGANGATHYAEAGDVACECGVSLEEECDVG